MEQMVGEHVLYKPSINFEFISPELIFFSVESTYGTHIHEKREDRENRFTQTVADTVTRGGRCLIPVFALGRAQVQS